MDTIELIILVLGTIGFVIFNWEFSVKARRYHGVFRFFSWESILILALLNWRNWFVDPFSWHQIVSWTFLTISIVPALQGFSLLRRLGKSQGQFEQTTILVTVGVYRYIRHPMYASLILLGLGVFFKQLSWASASLVALNTGALFATARTEEHENIERFGSEYKSYMQSTKMFIPYIF